MNEMGNPWGAIMVDVWDAHIQFGGKYDVAIGPMLVYATTIWSPELFPPR